MGHGDAYIIVKSEETGKIYRFPKALEWSVPNGYYKIYKHYIRGYGTDVYDENNELKPEFWATQRLAFYGGGSGHGY